MTNAQRKQAEKTISDNSVLDKYQAAAFIANDILKKIIKMCVKGASCRELSFKGDQMISEQCNAYSAEKNLMSGSAFPVCLSPDHCVGNFSPISEDDDVFLEEDSILKIEFGVHVDGYMVLVGHTIVVSAASTEIIFGRKADAFLAAYYASEAALNLFKPKTRTSAITKAIQEACKSYNCHPIVGIKSYQQNQFNIEGKKSINQNPSQVQKMEQEEFEIEVHEVYCLNTVISTGFGHAEDVGKGTTIFMKTGKSGEVKKKAEPFFSEISQKFNSLPFHLRNVEAESLKLGVSQCLKHDLIKPYRVLYEEKGEIVVQFKFTVMVFSDGPKKIISLPFDKSLFSRSIPRHLLKIDLLEKELTIVQAKYSVAIRSEECLKKAADAALVEKGALELELKYAVNQAEKLEFILLLRSEIEFWEKYFCYNMPQEDDFYTEVRAKNQEITDIQIRKARFHARKWIWILVGDSSQLYPALEKLKNELKNNGHNYAIFSNRIDMLYSVLSADIHTKTSLRRNYVKPTNLQIYLQIFSNDVMPAVETFTKSLIWP